jgi:hypothetical protein
MFARLMGDVATAMAGELASLAGGLDPQMLAAMGLSPEVVKGDPEAVSQAMMRELEAAFAAGAAAHAEQPLSLEGRSSSRWVGFAGERFECHTTFELDGGRKTETRRARGAVLRISRPGAAFFEVEKVRVMPASSVGNPEAPHWEVPAERTADGGLSATIPEIELALPEPVAAEGAGSPAPRAELLRRQMHTPFTTKMAENHGEMVVYLVGRLVGVGEGKVDVRAEMTAEDGAALSATSENMIEVKPALRLPALPEWVTPEDVRNQQHYVEDYGGVSWARGWLGFDRPWEEVREIVTRMVVDLAGLLLEVGRSEPKKTLVELDRKATDAQIRAALEQGSEVIVTGKMRMRARLDALNPDTVCLDCIDGEEASVDGGFSARVRRKGGEALEFPAPVAVTAQPTEGTPWARVLAELERGADVTLSAGPYDKAIEIEIKHQPEGSNFFPDPARAPETVRVELAWSCPRPTLAASARSLGRMGADLLTRAGAVPGQIGGVSLTAGSGSLMNAKTPYEMLVGAHRSANTPGWLAAHVRSPGHRVLVPADARTKLGAVPDGVEVRRLEHGTLLLAAGEDPFTSEREPMERAVLPLVGRDPRQT